ncbi:DNA-binding transcriptional regulator, GntR family [Sphaerotilus natans]|nr:DNA-binding transcriptional regulator, GntR family [Sphaerotilus natans]
MPARQSASSSSELPPSSADGLTPTGVVSTIAMRIVESLCGQACEPGHRLIEQALADELGVSRSPVRKALQYLETLGAVESVPNRGFRLVQVGDALRHLALPTDSDSDEANYLRVADDCLSGVLAAEVSEVELMDRYELTRIQVQRVLNRMGREGLAERKPGRGWVFRPFLRSSRSYHECYRFRMIIEPAALLEPGFRIDIAAFARARREQLAMLDGGIARWSRAELFRVGAEFHETVVACAGNSFLLESLRNLNQLRRLLEYRSNLDRTRLYRQSEEHLELLDLIEAGERVEASHRMRQHLDVVRGLKLQDPSPPHPHDADRPSGSGIEVHL